MRGALARRTRKDRVAVHPGALEPGNRHRIGTAARCRRATVGCTHNDVHLDNPVLHTGAVRPRPGFVESILVITPRSGTRTQVSETL